MDCESHLLKKLVIILTLPCQNRSCKSPDEVGKRVEIRKNGNFTTAVMSNKFIRVNMWIGKWIASLFKIIASEILKIDHLYRWSTEPVAQRKMYTFLTVRQTRYLVVKNFYFHNFTGNYLNKGRGPFSKWSVIRGFNINENSLYKWMGVTHKQMHNSRFFNKKFSLNI